MRLSGCIPNHREPGVCNDDAPVAVNEALFPLVRFAIALHEFGVSLCTGNSFIGMNDLVPFFQPAQFFLAVTQHLLQCPVCENRVAINIEETNPDLIVLENGAEKLLAVPQLPFGPLPISDVREDPCGGVDRSCLIKKREIDGNVVMGPDLMGRYLFKLQWTAGLRYLQVVRSETVGNFLGKQIVVGLAKYL